MPVMMSAAVASKPVRPSVRAPSEVLASTSVLVASVEAVVEAAASPSTLSVAVAMEVPASAVPVVTFRWAR